MFITYIRGLQTELNCDLRCAFVTAFFPALKVFSLLNVVLAMSFFVLYVKVLTLLRLLRKKMLSKPYGIYFIINYDLPIGFTTVLDWNDTTAYDHVMTGIRICTPIHPWLSISVEALTLNPRRVEASCLPVRYLRRSWLWVCLHYLYLRRSWHLVRLHNT